MNNERVDNNEVEEPPTSAKPEKNSLGLIWRIVAVVAALMIIAFLAYPWLQSRLKPDPDPGASANPQPVAAAPEATVQADPDSAEAWFELGKTYYEAEQWAQAIAAFQKTIELAPDFQAAHANLGAAYHRQERLDLAASQYEQALALNPDDGEVIYNLAALYIQKALQSGEQPDPDLLNKAVVQLHHALDLSPDSAEPYFGLGVAYMALNQREEAINAFEAFLARDSGQDPRAGQEAQRHLEFLRGQ